MARSNRRAARTRRAGPTLVGAALLAASLLGTDPLLAQAGAEAAGPGSPREPWLVWTVSSDADRLIFGQWTWHLSEKRRGDGVQNDRIVGFVYDGYFGGTFQTTHGPRAYALGIERHWLRVGSEAGRVALGYRMGLVYGYDGRLGWLAEAVPILPFAQPMVYAELGPFAAEFTHTWVVVSVSVAVSFR